MQSLDTQKNILIGAKRQAVDAVTPPTRTSAQLTNRSVPKAPSTATMSKGLHEQLKYFDSVSRRDKILIIFKMIAKSSTTVKVSDDGLRIFFIDRDKIADPKDLIISEKISETEALLKLFRDQEPEVLNYEVELFAPVKTSIEKRVVSNEVGKANQASSYIDCTRRRGK